MALAAHILKHQTAGMPRGNRVAFEAAAELAHRVRRRSMGNQWRVSGEGNYRGLRFSTDELNDRSGNGSAERRCLILGYYPGYRLSCGAPAQHPDRE